MWERSRVEELDSDDTDTQGVGLSSDYNRFSSDALQFTGIDMTAIRSRKQYNLRDSDEDSEDSAEFEYEGTDALQIALLDKEEALVQSALARIRRAQEKGKTEVKLNKAEIDALERRRKRMQAAATMTRKGSGSSAGSETEKKRQSDRNITIPIAPPANSHPSSRARAKSMSKGSSKRPETPPVMLVAGPDGLAYAPSAGYTAPTAKDRSPARPRASTNSRGMPPPAYYTVPQPRHVSDGNWPLTTSRPPSSSSTTSRRPLPDDESWEPSGSRRSSTASMNYQLNPFDYQVSTSTPPPIPHQYVQPQSRRNVSGSAETYSSRRSMHPSASGSSLYSTAARVSSDPTIPRRGAVSYNTRGGKEKEEFIYISSDEEEDDESDNGVTVYVDERDERRERASPPRGSKKSGKKKKGKR